MVLTWIANRRRASLGAFAAAGIVFGGAILWLTVSGAASSPSLLALLPRAANELLFPIGCAVLLYTAGLLSVPSTAVSPQRRARTA
jgi:hypothetical protein